MAHWVSVHGRVKLAKKRKTSPNVTSPQITQNEKMFFQSQLEDLLNP